MQRLMVGMGNGTPMTPVDSNSVSRPFVLDAASPGCGAKFFFTSRTHCSASCIPLVPVTAFAHPELTRIDCTRVPSACLAPSRKTWLETTTGAALNTLRVKVPAAAAGTVDTISARSGFGLGLDAAAAPPAGFGEMAALIAAYVEETTKPLGISEAEMGCANRAGLLSFAPASSDAAEVAKLRAPRPKVDRERSEEIIPQWKQRLRSGVWRRKVVGDEGRRGSSKVETAFAADGGVIFQFESILYQISRLDLLNKLLLLQKTP